MLFKYDYKVGIHGVEFSLVKGGDVLPVKGSRVHLAAVQRFVMKAWQDAINATSEPDEIRQLIRTPEGQKALADRAEAHLAKHMGSFPPELDRRTDAERRKSGRKGVRDRRRIGRSLQPA